jgi:tetratricopeptide (TPR) repeat protein
MDTNMNLKKTILAAGLLALPACLAHAAYEDVGVSARATGMSNAFTAVADDVYTIHYNPAGLATLGRPEFATSYSKLLTGLSDSSNLQNTFLAYEHPLKDGKWGTAGLAWNYFTLDNLYRESSLYMSYGRALFEDSMPGQLFGGVSLKYLDRSLGATDVANNAVGNTGAQVGSVDPVLQHTSKSNMDLDWGVLYRPAPRWTLGLTVQHFLEPNIAFSPSDTDTLGRNYKLGGSYKTPFSTLSMDLDFVKAPDNSTDKQFALAAEKWLPTLVHGSFAVRGSLAAGSRSYRQLALGVSYRIHKLQFDYGFNIPLGGLSGTSGSHRLGLTFRFGRAGGPTEPTMAEAIAENLNDLAAVGTPEFKYQMEDLALFKRTAIDELLRQAKLDVSNGRFADALEKLDQASSLKPGDPRIEASRERLRLVSSVYPLLRDYSTDPAQAALYEGALDFLIGKDKEALKKIAYAQSLAPASDKPEALLEAIEKAAGVTRAAPPSPAQPSVSPAQGAEKVVAGDLALMEVAMREREYDRVIKLASQVIELDPANALAYKRMGSAYYALHRNTEALRALRSAYKLEKDPEEKKKLRGYVDALAAVIEQKSQAQAAASRAEVKQPTKSPQDIERLYEAGVDLYAQGKLPEAAAMFKKILELDPSNISGQRALDRVQTELIQGGKH